MQHKTIGIFTHIIFDHKPTLEEVIKGANWGSNRDIRQRGFRIDTKFSNESPFFSKKVKEMERVTNPKRIILDGQAILTLKGTQVLVIKVEQ